MAISKRPITVHIIYNKKKDRLMIDMMNSDMVQVLEPRIIYHEVSKDPNLRRTVIDHIKQVKFQGMNIQAIQKNKLRITMGDITDG